MAGNIPAMAAKEAGKRPAPRKTPAKKPAVPAKAPAGKVAPKKAVKKIEKDSVKDNPDRELTPKEQEFVEQYLIDLNGTQAAIRAHYRPNSARQTAARMLSKANIQAAISVARKAQQERTQVTADQVVKELALIAFADARELSYVVRQACRHCHGRKHLFHWRDEDEFASACAAVEADNKASDGEPRPMPSDAGGFGYSSKLPPHPDCPKCDGDGDAVVKLADTRTLSPKAVALYAGAKEGKYGIEVQMHSKMDAMEKLAKHLGVYEKDNEQKTDPLSSILARIATSNGNGFMPIQDDPERPSAAKPGSMLPIVQDPNEGDED